MAEVTTLTIVEAVVEIVEIDGETLLIAADEQLDLVEIGQQGPPGVGIPVPINFAWGDASPALLATVPAGKRVYVCDLQIQTAFNGVGATLSLGPLAAPGELMSTSENAPGTVATYQTNPNKLYASATGIYLTITPGAGASAGSGQIRLQLET